MPIEGNSFKTTISIPLDIYNLINEAKTPNFKLATFIHQMMSAVLQDEEFIKELYRAMNDLGKKELFPVVELLLRKSVDEYNSRN